MRVPQSVRYDNEEYEEYEEYDVKLMVLSNRVIGCAIEVHRELGRGCWSQPVSGVWRMSCI